jgi:hypothetical protein
MNFAKWGISLAEMKSEKWPSAPVHSVAAEEIWYRAVSVSAPVGIVFRWICQLRAAPYSYDWIDNLGCQSPRHLADKPEPLRIGQSVMTVFRLEDFSVDSFLTIIPWSERGALFSGLRITYLCLAVEESQTRLVVRVQICYPRHLLRPLIRAFLPWGDLVMMRKQLLTLKHLAERSWQE